MINLNRILICFLVVFSCKKNITSTDANKLSMGEVQPYYIYFNAQEKTKCETELLGIARIKLQKSHDSISYYQKTIVKGSEWSEEPGSIYFTFCDFGSLVHRPSEHIRKEIMVELDTIKRIFNKEMLNELNFQRQIFIVEPLSDHEAILYEVGKNKIIVE